MRAVFQRCYAFNLLPLIMHSISRKAKMTAGRDSTFSRFRIQEKYFFFFLYQDREFSVNSGPFWIKNFIDSRVYFPLPSIYIRRNRKIECPLHLHRDILLKESLVECFNRKKEPILEQPIEISIVCREIWLKYKTKISKRAGDTVERSRRKGLS